MQTALIIAIALHALSGVFWAGSTFVLARTGGQGADRLRKPQMGAAGMAVLTGMVLGKLAHQGAFGSTEAVLAVGAVSAVVAGVVQFTTSRRGAQPGAVVVGQRIAAGLLAVAVLCMVVARYV